MIRLLQLLFLGHVHKWKTVKTEDMVIKALWQNHGSDFTRYHLQCEECGKITHYETR